MVRYSGGHVKSERNTWQDMSYWNSVPPRIFPLCQQHKNQRAGGMPECQNV